MSEIYFKILEGGKNVRKFIFRRSSKMSENDLAKKEKCRKMNQESIKMSIFYGIKMPSYFKKMIF